LDVPLKMMRLKQWCEDINRVQSNIVYDFVYVDEESYQKHHPLTFRQLLDGFREYKEADASQGAASAGSLSVPGYRN
jgi:type III restriction enzyme